MYSSQAISLHIIDTAAGNSSSSDTASKVAFAVGSAIIGAACSYVVALLLARRNPHKQLSWEATTDRSMLSVSSEIRDNVSIRYKSEDVSNLVAIKCRVINTGNTVIEDDQLRFAFPNGTKILEADFSPQPERELRASKVDLPDLKETECIFFIGQLGAGQEVSFELMATGLRSEEWGLHQSKGDVEFRQRDANRIKDEQEHIRPVVIITAFFVNQFVASIGVLIDLALAISLTPHILPIARIIQRLVTRWLMRPDPTTSVSIQGDDARVVASSGTVEGGVRFGQ
jgi:hypothetical protein